MTISSIAPHHKFIRHWVPVILVMGFIYWMSTATFSSMNTISWIDNILRHFIPHLSYKKIALINTMIRKAGHVIEYFALGLLLFRAFRGERTASWNWRWSFLAVLVVVLWAVSDEFHQSFVSTRTASVADVGIDMAGGILAQFAVALSARYRKK